MKKIDLSLFPFILLRTPLQSLKHAYEFPTKISAIFQEGLYLSSPEFWQELKKNEVSFQNNEKIRKTFSKYWLRSSTRCTPYGIFAGSSLINIAEEETNIILSNCSQHTRFVRLDMNYMSDLIAAISKNPVITDQVTFFANNSIYYLADSIRYAEYTVQENIRYYNLTSVEKTDYLIAVLKKAGNKGASIQELLSILAKFEDVTEEEAKMYILNLWQSQLIVSELEPCITGNDPLESLINQISRFKGVNELISLLTEIRRHLRHPRSGVTYYQNIEKKLHSIDFSFKTPKNKLQTDLFLSTCKNTINKSLVENILIQVSDLMLLSRRNINVDLNTFKINFYSRYGDEEVPLNRALDSDVGIGYSGINSDNIGQGALIDDLQATGEDKKYSKEFDYIAQYTLSKYHDYLKNQKPLIEISEDELKRFKHQIKNLSFPSSMFIMGSLLKKDGLLDSENFLFDLSILSGPSAGNLLGRFAQGNVQMLHAIKEILKEEEIVSPEIVFAEIVHLPQTRLGNILLRPILRKYEIPYVGKSGIEQEKQIFIDDLYVSIKNKEIILRSKSLNKRVLPRLTTAHNFSFRSLPIYKFLCDLQHQNLAVPCVWDWGHLETLKHLPRVIYKNTVLKKARWIITESDMEDMPQNRSECYIYFRNFCTKWNIPDSVVYKEGDNELLINFKENAGISLFTHYLKKNKAIQIEEFLFNEKNCIVKDNDQNPFTNELIIPVANKQFINTYRSEGELSIDGVSHTKKTLKRKFSINSEWLYFKIYCGPYFAEKLLKNIIFPFIEAGIKKKFFEHFFFIRYKDEDSHLRIRFYNSNPKVQLLLQKEFTDMLNSYVEDGLIEKVMIDSYCREIERYEEKLIEETELLFFNDSIAVLRFINLLEDGEDTEKYRILFALRAIDMFLKDFGLSDNEKLRLSKEIASGFFAEFGGNSILQKQLNNKYRIYQKDIFSHMDNEQDNKNGVTDAVDVFKIRSSMNEPAIKNILSKIPVQKKELLFRLLPNYIHMFMNRLFIAHQRKYELVTYHFLERFYMSQIAINKTLQSH